MSVCAPVPYIIGLQNLPEGGLSKGVDYLIVDVNQKTVLLPENFPELPDESKLYP